MTRRKPPISETGHPRRWSSLTVIACSFVLITSFGGRAALAQQIRISECIIISTGDMKCFTDSGVFDFLNAANIHRDFVEASTVANIYATKAYVDSVVPDMLESEYATKAYVDSALSTPGILDVVHADLAKQAFTFGFFGIFSIWMFGFGLGLVRRLLLQLSS